MVVTDSIEVHEEKTGGKIVQISVDQLMAEAIRRIHETAQWVHCLSKFSLD